MSPLCGRLLGVLLALFCCAARPAGAQARLVVVEEPDGTAVGLAVLLNAGSAWELESEAGLACLAARAVIEDVSAALEALGGRAAVTCDAVSLGFTLLLAPERWEEAAAFFLDGLFHRPVSASAVERARSDLVRLASFREGHFPSEAREALARTRFGDGHRWARPPWGRPETLSALEAEDALRLARTRFVPSRATAAVAGPVDPEAALAVLWHAIPDGRLPVLAPAPASRSRAGRRHFERATVTSWAALAFPFESGTGEEALRLLAFHLRELAAPSLSRPEIYDAETLIERHGGGGALLVYLVTSPDHAGRWVETVQGTVERLADAPLPPPAFEALLRRYRGARLLELSTPEARAREAAQQLFFEREYRAPAARIDALSADQLRRAAAALRRPAVAVLGPR